MKIWQLKGRALWTQLSHVSSKSAVSADKEDNDQFQATHDKGKYESFILDSSGI